jgi:hypothetical protein
LAECYIETRPGDGTLVAENLADLPKVMLPVLDTEPEAEFVAEAALPQRPTSKMHLTLTLPARVWGVEVSARSLVVGIECPLLSA